MIEVVSLLILSLLYNFWEILLGKTLVIKGGSRQQQSYEVLWESVKFDYKSSEFQ